MNHLPRMLKDYFRSNMGLFILVSVIFVCGVVFGSVCVNLLSDNQKADILNHIQGLLANVGNIRVDALEVFNISLQNNLKALLLIVILGITIIGFPVIFAVVFLRGFILGFSVGFLMENLGAKGWLLSILSILPQNLIIIPSLVCAAVAGVIFPVTVIRRRKILPSESYSRLVLSYLIYNFSVGVLLVFASLLEGYVSPTLIKLVSNYI